MTPEQKEKVIRLLERNELGVIATNSAGTSPESAVVAVSHTDDLELIFGSFKGTRKNANIATDPYVSMVIGWDKKEKKTLQVEGATVLLSGDERARAEAVHCAKNPASEKFMTDPRQEYFKITPHWFRYSDYSVNPQVVWEVTI